MLTIGSSLAPLDAWVQRIGDAHMLVIEGRTEVAMADLEPVDQPIHLCEHDSRWRSWFVDERDRVVRGVPDYRPWTALRAAC